MNAVRADERRSDFVWDLYVYLKPLNEWADGLNDGVVFVHPAALHEAFGITMQQMSLLKRGHDYHPNSMVKGGRCSSQRLEDLVWSHLKIFLVPVLYDAMFCVGFAPNKTGQFQHLGWYSGGSPSPCRMGDPN